MSVSDELIPLMTSALQEFPLEHETVIFSAASSLRRYVRVSNAATAGWPEGFSHVWTDPEAAERRAVAKRFARLARNILGVQEVRLNETMPDLEVSVVVRATDLDRELELRGIFIELVCEELDPTLGELFVYAEDEAPTWVQEGALLT